MSSATDERRIEIRRGMPMFWRTAPAAMSIEPLTPPSFPVPGTPGATATLRAAVATPAPAPSAARAVEDAPGHDAMEAVRTAARAYEQLRANGRELHFKSTESGMRIEVYNGHGELIRRIPPNEALALASGEATWLA